MLEFLPNKAVHMGCRLSFLIEANTGRAPTVELSSDFRPGEIFAHNSRPQVHAAHPPLDESVTNGNNATRFLTSPACSLLCCVRRAPPARCHHRSRRMRSPRSPAQVAGQDKTGVTLAAGRPGLDAVSTARQPPRTLSLRLRRATARGAWPDDARGK